MCMISTSQTASVSNSSVFCFLHEITLAVINNLGFEKGAVWICKGNFSIIYAQSKIGRIYWIGVHSQVISTWASLWNEQAAPSIEELLDPSLCPWGQICPDVMHHL